MLRSQSPQRGWGLAEQRTWLGVAEGPAEWRFPLVLPFLPLEGKWALIEVASLIPWWLSCLVRTGQRAQVLDTQWEGFWRLRFPTRENSTSSQHHGALPACQAQC